MSRDVDGSFAVESDDDALTSGLVLGAIQHWTTDQIKHLIDKDPAAFCRVRSAASGQTAIHWAAVFNRTEVLQYILDCGAAEDDDPLNAPAPHPTDPKSNANPHS